MRATLTIVLAAACLGSATAALRACGVIRSRSGCNTRRISEGDCTWSSPGRSTGNFCRAITESPTEREYEPEYEREYEYEGEYEGDYSSDDEYEYEQDMCDNTCGFPNDGACDDGGEGAEYSECALGTDCDDCGRRSQEYEEYEEYEGGEYEHEYEYEHGEYEREYEYEVDPCGFGTALSLDTNKCEIHYEIVCGPETVEVDGVCLVDFSAIVASSNLNNGPFKCAANGNIKINTASPSMPPTDAPTIEPTRKPSAAPTLKPTRRPSTAPTKKPTSAPSVAPTSSPTSVPTLEPTEAPTAPTSSPTVNCARVPVKNCLRQSGQCQVNKRGRRKSCGFTPPPTTMTPTSLAPSAAPTVAGFSYAPSASPTSFCAQLAIRDCLKGTNRARCKKAGRGRRTRCLDK